MSRNDSRQGRLGVARQQGASGPMDDHPALTCGVFPLLDTKSKEPRAESQEPRADVLAPWPPWAEIVDIRFLNLDHFDDDGRLIRPLPMLSAPWELVDLGDDDHPLDVECTGPGEALVEPWSFDQREAEGGEG